MTAVTALTGSDQSMAYVVYCSFGSAHHAMAHNTHFTVTGASWTLRTMLAVLVPVLKWYVNPVHTTRNSAVTGSSYTAIIMTGAQCYVQSPKGMGHTHHHKVGICCPAGLKSHGTTYQCVHSYVIMIKQSLHSVSDAAICMGAELCRSTSHKLTGSSAKLSV